MTLGAPPIRPVSTRLKTGSSAETRGVVLLGGAHGALAVARSMGRAGIPVWFLDDKLSIARFSRYVSRHVQWNPGHPNALSLLLDLVRQDRLQGWVLFAGSDSDARFVATHHRQLSMELCCAVASWDILRWADDKRLMHQRAQELGLCIPRTATARTDADLAHIGCGYPAVLKPAVHAERNVFTQEKAWRVNNHDELLARHRRAADLLGSELVLIQEMIPGTGSAQFSYAAVWDSGKPVASLVARRVRQYPIEFGYTSTYVEVTHCPQVEEAAVSFLGSIGYHGLVEVEFKHDARDGCFKMLDVNPRVWTWIGLGARAGVDFPRIMWHVATNQPLTSVKPRDDAAWVYASRDAVAALQEIGAGQTSLRSCLTDRKSVTFAAFAWDDPLPALLDLPLAAWRYLTRRLPTAFHRVPRHPGGVRGESAVAGENYKVSGGNPRGRAPSDDEAYPAHHTF